MQANRRWDAGKEKWYCLSKWLIDICLRSKQRFTQMRRVLPWPDSWSWWSYRRKLDWWSKITKLDIANINIWIFGLLQKQVWIANAQPNTFLSALQTVNDSTDICWIQPQMPQSFEFAMLIIRCRTIESTQKLCCNDLLWKVQIFDCKSYYAETEVK